MFKIFKNKIKKEDYNFLKIITKKLPLKYSYLIDQVSKEFLLNKQINKLGDEGCFTLSLNSNLESKYSNKLLPQFFIIKDIAIWNKSKLSFDFIELHILEGMLAGFKINSNYLELDFNKIDISQIKEKNFNNEDRNFLKKIIGTKIPTKILESLEVESTFKIKLNEGDFYVIKNFQDGNYLSIDANGKVYIMIHDPYIIKQVYADKETFFKELSNGNFNISKYYNEIFK